jgi:hypothetical protein
MDPKHRNRLRLATASPALLLASVVLAACGGSSSPGSSQSGGVTSASSPSRVAPADTASVAAPSTAATTPAAGATTTATAAPSLSASKAPSSPAKAPSPSAGKVTGGAGSLAGAVENCVRKEGAKKCGVAGGGAAGTPSGVNPPAGKTGSAAAEGRGVTAFITCMRANGVTIPEEGSGGATSTASATFKAAAAKCGSELTGGD